MSYIAPVKDMLFNMAHLGGLEQIAQLPAFEDAGLETAQAVLEECAKLNESVLSPLNWEGDKNPSYFKDGHVHTTPGLKKRMTNTERADGKACNTRQLSVDKVCPKPLERLVAKF